MSEKGRREARPFQQPQAGVPLRAPQAPSQAPAPAPAPTPLAVPPSFSEPFVTTNPLFSAPPGAGTPSSSWAQPISFQPQILSPPPRPNLPAFPPPGFPRNPPPPPWSSAPRANSAPPQTTAQAFFVPILAPVPGFGQRPILPTPALGARSSPVSALSPSIAQFGRHNPLTPFDKEIGERSVFLVAINYDEHPLPKVASDILNLVHLWGLGEFVSRIQNVFPLKEAGGKTKVLVLDARASRASLMSKVKALAVPSILYGQSIPLNHLGFYFSEWEEPAAHKARIRLESGKAISDESAANVLALASSPGRLLLSQLPPDHEFFLSIGSWLAEVRNRCKSSSDLHPYRVEELSPDHPIVAAICGGLDEMENSWSFSALGENPVSSLSLQRSYVSSLHKQSVARLSTQENESCQNQPAKTNVPNISSLNIRGKASSNSDELSQLLKRKNIDILGLQEVLSSQVSVNGYKWFPGRKRAPRLTRREGTTNQGIGFLIKESIKTLVSVVSIDVDFEIMWIKIAAKGQTDDTYVDSVYGPGENYPIANGQAFFESLTEQCLKYSAKGDIILLGDFNAHLKAITGDTINESSYGRLLKNLLQLAFNNGESDSYPSILNTCSSAFGQATRQEGTSVSIIDYMICSLPSLARVSSFHIENKSQDDGANACGSDHHLLSLKWKQSITHTSFAQLLRFMWDIDCLQDEVVRKKYQASLSIHLPKYKSLADSLTLAPGFDKLPFVLRQSLQDTVAALFNHHITLAMASAVPVKKVTSFSKPYWDESLRDLQARRSAAHSKMRNYEHMMASTSSEQVDLAMNPL
jgi:endonuclease/exonuclease/phosphatase family metal-dependent hydrolase